MSNSRRDFVKTAAGLGLAAAAATAETFGKIPKRPLGKTGLEVTILGLGGAKIGQLPNQKDAVDVARRCYDLGVNYFDTAAAGAYGLSQQRYGVALADFNKNLIFGTKTRHRDAAHSELDLNQSLANLKRDWIDLYQVHNVMHEDDIEAVFAPKGLMEMIEKAKKAGKIRFVGFTGHMDPRVLKRMLSMYDFDTVLMPLSLSDGARRGFSFEHETLPAAAEKGLGILAMKVTGVGALPKQNLSTLEDCLNYVWSLPVSTAILGCDTLEQVDADVRAAVKFEQNRLSEQRMEELRQKWAAANLDQLEPWKADQSARTAAAPRYAGD